jgi:hypothetical protein
MGAPLGVKRKRVVVHSQELIPDDPDDPNGRQRRGTRARVYWAPEYLAGGRSPSLEPYHVTAANRYLADFLVGEMAAKNGPDLSGIHVAAWNRMPYSARRVEARQSFKSAQRAAGPKFQSILNWCVLQLTPGPLPTVQAWAVANNCPVMRATGFLWGALELLSVHYDNESKSVR